VHEAEIETSDGPRKTRLPPLAFDFRLRLVRQERPIDDLKAAIESGRSIEEAAEFLCRADSVDDVARKCEELGLRRKVRPG
jgi:hypothetical protein